MLTFFSFIIFYVAIMLSLYNALRKFFLTIVMMMAKVDMTQTIWHTQLIPSSKDHIAAALLSKLMTLLLWFITPVRICLVKQWPHIMSTQPSTTTDWEKAW